MSTILSYHEESFDNGHCTNTSLSKLWRFTVSTLRWNIILRNLCLSAGTVKAVGLLWSQQLWTRLLETSFTPDLFFIPSSSHGSKELVTSCCWETLAQYKSPWHSQLSCVPKESAPSATLSFSKILQVQAFNYLIKTTIYCFKLVELTWLHFGKDGTKLRHYWWMQQQKKKGN